eukprot:PhM_4_TR1079/c0_g1_i1/m.26873
MSSSVTSSSMSSSQNNYNNNSNQHLVDIVERELRCNALWCLVTSFRVLQDHTITGALPEDFKEHMMDVVENVFNEIGELVAETAPEHRALEAVSSLLADGTLYLVAAVAVLKDIPPTLPSYASSLFDAGRVSIATRKSEQTQLVLLRWLHNVFVLTFPDSTAIKELARSLTCQTPLDLDAHNRVCRALCQYHCSTFVDVDLAEEHLVSLGADASACRNLVTIEDIVLTWIRSVLSCHDQYQQMGTGLADLYVDCADGKVLSILLYAYYPDQLDAQGIAFGSSLTVEQRISNWFTIITALHQIGVGVTFTAYDVVYFGVQHLQLHLLSVLVELLSLVCEKSRAGSSEEGGGGSTQTSEGQALPMPKDMSSGIKASLNGLHSQHPTSNSVAVEENENTEGDESAKPNQTQTADVTHPSALMNVTYLPHRTIDEVVVVASPPYRPPTRTDDDGDDETATRDAMEGSGTGRYDNDADDGAEATIMAGAGMMGLGLVGTKAVIHNQTEQPATTENNQQQQNTTTATDTFGEPSLTSSRQFIPLETDVAEKHEADLPSGQRHAAPSSRPPPTEQRSIETSSRTSSLLRHLQHADDLQPMIRSSRPGSRSTAASMKTSQTLLNTSNSSVTSQRKPSPTPVRASAPTTTTAGKKGAENLYELVTAFDGERAHAKDGELDGCNLRVMVGVITSPPEPSPPTASTAQEHVSASTHSIPPAPTPTQAPPLPSPTTTTSSGFKVTTTGNHRGAVGCSVAVGGGGGRKKAPLIVQGSIDADGISKLMKSLERGVPTVAVTPTPASTTTKTSDDDALKRLQRENFALKAALMSYKNADAARKARQERRVPKPVEDPNPAKPAIATACTSTNTSVMVTDASSSPQPTPQSCDVSTVSVTYPPEPSETASEASSKPSAAPLPKPLQNVQRRDIQRKGSNSGAPSAAGGDGSNAVPRSNVAVIRNAIKYACLPGEVNKAQQSTVLSVIDGVAEADPAAYFLVLLKPESMLFKAVYHYSPQTAVLRRCYGVGPMEVTPNTSALAFKYNTSGKKFVALPATTPLNAMIADAFTLPRARA